ncbi:MAG: hypothetical protein LPK09_02110 [Hymenobacteraceae bacterium]|nr:hypothetical protein [Hymenobacteraceae bacterium]
MINTFPKSGEVERVVLMKTDYVEITLNNPGNYLIVTWLRPVLSHEYKHGIEETGHILLANKLEKLLVNNQRMGVLTMEDQGWLAEISIRVISKSKLRWLAVISSTDFLQQITNERLDARVKESTPYFDTQYFLTERDGLEWLLQE